MLKAQLVVLLFYGSHTTHTCLISEFEFFCAVCSVQVLCIFLVPAWILGESNCHQFSWHWALIGSFHFPPYSSDIWLVFRPYLGIRIESFNNVCWPIKKYVGLPEINCCVFAHRHGESFKYWQCFLQIDYLKYIMHSHFWQHSKEMLLFSWQFWWPPSNDFPNSD